MIVSRTPLRMSFIGGGTDLPDFCARHGGAVVSTSIDKWIHVAVSRRFEGDVRVCYSTVEIVPSMREVRHDLVRESMRRAGIPRGVDIITIADVPSRGTGLGSSSAVTLGLLNALYAFQGIQKPAQVLAEEAARIEIDVLGKPIGRQDQYAIAFGGLNLIEFLPTGEVRISPIVCPPGTLERAHRMLLLFYSGEQRASDDLIERQAAAIRSGTNIECLLRLRDLAYELAARLGEGEATALPEVLGKGFALKQAAAPGSADGPIADMYARAVDAGAIGGKVLGAGGGGFLLIAADHDQQAEVRGALKEFREVPFRFTGRGTHLTLYEHS